MSTSKTFLYVIGVLLCFTPTLSVVAQEGGGWKALSLYSTCSKWAKHNDYTVDILVKKYVQEDGPSPRFVYTNTLTSVRDAHHKYLTMMEQSNGVTYIRTSEKLFIIDNDEGKFVQMKGSKRSNSDCVDNETYFVLGSLYGLECYAPGIKSLLYDAMNRAVLYSVKDTVVGSTHYALICGEMPTIKPYNVKYFCNRNLRRIERVELICTDSTYAGVDRIEYELSFKPAISASTIINQTDSSNPSYANYKFMQNIYGGNHPKYALDTLESIPSEMMTFPLVNLVGDTITLEQQHGWLLLYMFNHGCYPCAKFFQQQKDEVDSTGDTRLNRAGITLMPLNVSSINRELTKKDIAGRLDDKQVFISRGLGEIVDVIKYPMTYLVSPNNKVFTCTRNDVDGIIALKREKEEEAANQ